MRVNDEDIKDKLRTVTELQDDIRFYKRIDVSRAYDRTMDKIGRRQRKALLWNTFNRAAAILFIPLLVCTAVLFYRNNHSAESPVAETYAEVTVSPGTVMQLELPDRSHVWLNSESSLRYPVVFKGETRAVELKGEGFFHVHPNAAVPFEVTVPSGLKVVARGTEFNVKAYDDDDVNEVVLQEGVIDVICRSYHETVQPGEMVRLDWKNKRMSRSAVQTDEKTAWKDGRMIFRNTPMEEVFKQLSRRYNVDIQVRNPKQKSYLVRATFSSETLPQILDFLKLAAPVEWRMAKAEQNGDSTFSRQQINVTIK
jgi:ferric-dicitrate binding protein FerR (iron transport regulator)